MSDKRLCTARKRRTLRFVCVWLTVVFVLNTTSLTAAAITLSLTGNGQEISYLQPVIAVVVTALAAVVTKALRLYAKKG